MAEVLVVDDNEEMLEMLSRFMEVIGHTPHMVASGEEALRALRDGAYDLVLLDLMMPGIDGFGVLETMRAIPETAAIPVIVVTAASDPYLEEKVEAAGAQWLFNKPVRLGDLEEQVEALIQGEGAIDFTG